MTRFTKWLCAVAAIVLLSTSAYATNKPIPGVDVVVKKNPGGLKVAQGTTDQDGQVLIENLPAGKYQLEIVPKMKAVNTSRSNIKHPSSKVGKDGVEEHKVDIEFSMGTGTALNAPVDFEITATKGKITVVISRDEVKKTPGKK